MEAKTPPQEPPPIQEMKRKLLETKKLVEFSFGVSVLPEILLAKEKGSLRGTKKYDPALASPQASHLELDVVSLFLPSPKVPLYLLVSDPPASWHLPSPTLTTTALTQTSISDENTTQPSMVRDNSVEERASTARGRGGGGRGRASGRGRGGGHGGRNSSDPPRRAVLWLSDSQCEDIAEVCGSPLPSKDDLFTLTQSRGCGCDELIKLPSEIENLHVEVFPSLHHIREFLRKNWVNKELGSDPDDVEDGQQKQAAEFSNSLIDGFKVLLGKKALASLLLVREKWRNLIPRELWSLATHAQADGNPSVNRKDRRLHRLVSRVVAVDIEAWEFNQSIITEVGWSSLDFLTDLGLDPNIPRVVERNEGHMVVKENERYRNGKHVPDHRDEYAFGQTKTVPTQTVLSNLRELFAPVVLSAVPSKPKVFLVFHNAQADLKYLEHLGIRFGNSKGEIKIMKLQDLVDQQKNTKNLNKEFYPSNQSNTHDATDGLLVVDTQVIARPWIETMNAGDGKPVSGGLEKVCEVMNIESQNLHNAGNDAHATLDVFLKLVISDFPSHTS